MEELVIEEKGSYFVGGVIDMYNYYVVVDVDVVDYDYDVVDVML